MSDRLDELRRLRAQAQEQLAWFDREIAREEGKDTPRSASACAAAPARSASSVPRSFDVDDTQPDQIIERFTQGRPSIRHEVRRGCFLYFGAAFALLIAALALFYVFGPTSR